MQKLSYYLSDCYKKVKGKWDSLIPACVKANMYLPLEMYLTLESNCFVSACIWMCVWSTYSRLLCVTGVSLKKPLDFLLQSKKKHTSKLPCLLDLTSSHFKTENRQGFSLFRLNDMSGYPKPKGWVPAMDF